MSINFDLPAHAPILLPEYMAALCRASESICSESLHEFAKQFVTLSGDGEGLPCSKSKRGILRYGQAIAKFMGNSGFRQTFSISENDFLPEPINGQGCEETLKRHTHG